MQIAKRTALGGRNAGLEKRLEACEVAVGGSTHETEYFGFGHCAENNRGVRGMQDKPGRLTLNSPLLANDNVDSSLLEGCPSEPGNFRTVRKTKEEATKEKFCESWCSRFSARKARSRVLMRRATVRV